ncbi:MAG TPA: PKD domain-containing protein, partial [Gaiellales bacterium]
VFAATGCGSDANNDPLTFSAAGPKNGTITGAGATLAFTPTLGFTGQASVILTASDGELSSAPTTVPITILPAQPIGVDITTKDVLSTRTDRPIQLTARPVSETAIADAITWDFDDGTTDTGASVSHLFTASKTYTVRARIGQGPVSTVRVIVQAPPVFIRDTSLLHKNTIKLRLRLANAGTLKVSLAGVPGSRKLQAKMKRGAHTVKLLVPKAALHRGTIVVLLSLTGPGKVVVKMRRAVLLPRG